MAQTAPQNKEILGHNEECRSLTNSVRYYHICLVAIVQHNMKLKRSTYEVLQILSISLADNPHLCDLFDKTNFNDVKDINAP